MIFADTGFFLALCQPRDALHGRAQAWSKFITEPLMVSEAVLLETVNALSKPVDRAKAHHLINSIRSAKGYEIVYSSPVLFEAGMQLHAERPDKEWSLTDCISFVIMKERGICRALAYDHHFEQAGFEALLRHDPP